MKQLVKRLLRPGESPEQGAVRIRLGTVGSSVGMAANILLAAAKFLVGTLSGSVAIVADAANNFSDAAGSVVSLVSLRLAQKPVDREHPFGHGRLEYLGALAVGVLILVMGVELMKSGVESILHPAAPAFSWVMLGVLVGSAAVKVLLSLFSQSLGALIDASALTAAGKDAMSDAMATSVVALSMLASHFFGWHLDGVMGVLVALLVLKAGWEVCRDTVDRLLGGKPDPEIGRQLTALLKKRELVLGVHDLILHDYGPGRCFASVHAEVPADGDLLDIHEMIDDAEQEIARELHVPVCIHMDPVVSGDCETARITAALNAHLEAFHKGLRLHDLRRVPGENHINLIFDVAVPVDYRQTEALRQSLEAAARVLDDRHRCVICFDVDYFHDA